METYTGELCYQDQKFSYEEKGQSRILLDCQDYFANKSRIPMHSFVEENITVPAFLLGLGEHYGELSESTGEEENAEEIQLISVLTAASLIRSALPVKAVELGCTSGVLSYYLAKILGTFNPESILSRIMTAECKQGLPEEAKGVLWRRKVEKYAGQLKEVLMQEPESFSQRLESGWDMEEVSKQLNQYIREAMERGELEWKIRLIDIKELVLDSWINGKTDAQEGLKRIWSV